MPKIERVVPGSRIKSREEQIRTMSKDKRDWLEIFGNQYRPAKVMPGTCEACVWGRSEHSKDCSIAVSRCVLTPLTWLTRFK